MSGCVYVWDLKCVGVCTYGFLTSGYVYYGFCNVFLCVCMGFELSWFVYVLVIYCPVVSMYGIYMSGCVYVWVL